MPNILIIDSDKQVGRHLEENVRAVYDGAALSFSLAGTDEEALTLIDTGQSFDVALVAIDSPGLSGLSVFSRIKEKSFRVPRIAVSSASDLSGIRKAMNDGAVDFLVKPIEVDDFKATIERVLADVERRRRNWQERSEYFALMREIDIAVDIQQRILPRDFPGIEGYGVHATTRAAKSMGGDFYDVFNLENGNVGMVMADVSGKGIPAAFYMAVAHTLLRSVANSGAEPEACLRQVNELLCEYHIPGMFVSAVYGVLDPAAHTFTFANAGHQHPYKRSPDGSLTTFEGGEGTVLGVMPEMTFSQETVSLHPEEFLLMYTDGVTEAFDAERKPFGEAELEACLKKGNFRDASRVLAAIDDAIQRHVGDADTSDDLTCLVVRRN